MGKRIVREVMLLVLAAFTFMLSLHGVEGKGNISREEDLELEKQVKLLDKGVVKIIKVNHGEVFHCIDIYKQPAFSHPLLKNHTIQMRPSSFPKGFEIEASKSASPFPKIGLRSLGGRCPQGTVPILRTRKEDLIRAKSLPRRYRANDEELTSNPTGYHFAAAKTQTSLHMHGAIAEFSIHRPNVTANQFSEVLIWIQNGPQDQINSIQVGSTINPKLYGDNDPHLFGYWTADGYRKTGCFDIRCPGFIQVGKDTTFGQKLLPITDKKHVYVNHFLVFRDPQTGNWWLTLPHAKENIGYWPKSLFTSLASYATEIQWGGEVYTPLNKVTPQMGSGYFLSGNWQKTCFACNMKVVDESNKFIELANIPISIVEDKPDCYAVEYKGYQGDAWRYRILFGGPGGLNCKI